MRVADFQRDELLTSVFRLFGDRLLFDCRSVAHAYETQDGGVTFADTQDVVLEVGSNSSCVCR